MSWAARLALIFGLLNLAWESLQLPFYTIWTTATPGEIAYDVIHCTGGDILIGAAIAVLLRFVFGLFPAAVRQSWSFPMGFILLGVAYTVFSEWLNVDVLRNWAYADAMPLVPPLGTGLTPLLQWVIVPLLTWAATGEPVRTHLAGRHVQQGARVP